MFTSLFSFIKTPKSSSVEHSHENNSLALDDFILAQEATLLTDFTLFHHVAQNKIDLLLFLPHYGLYLGEKIEWTLRELKGASVKRLTRYTNNKPHTNIESTENTITQKLQDVLSFDSTPIQRIFWMKNLNKAEFETLSSTFHELLPKSWLIFNDDTTVEIQTKLCALQNYQTQPFSKLKVIGSLAAHFLLLPNLENPFGAFLSPQQQLFLDAQIKTRTTLCITGPSSSGKSTVLIRKILDYLLSNPHESVLVITPTKLAGEMLRNELIALMEFSATRCNLLQIHFYTHTEDDQAIHTNPLFHSSTLIACDDAHMLHADILEQIIQRKGSRSLLLSSVTLPNFHYTQNCTFDLSYRIPNIHTINFTHTKGALFTLLSGLKTHLEAADTSPIMILLPTNKVISEYKKVIEEHLKINCRVLNEHFSLQYDNLEQITLSIPQYSCGISVRHSYLINIDNADSLYYPLALSRASDTVTIISETNLEK